MKLQRRELMKLRKLVTQAFYIINFLILLTGFCGVARAADKETIEDMQRLIK